MVVIGQSKTQSLVCRELVVLEWPVRVIAEENIECKCKAVNCPLAHHLHGTSTPHIHAFTSQLLYQSFCLNKC